MKLKSFFAALFVAVACFSGCSKDDDDDAPADPVTQQPVNNNPQVTPGMTAKVDNTDWTATSSSGVLQSGNLSVGGGTLNGKAIALSTQSGGVTQPGTYSIVGIYSEIPLGSTSGPTWMGPTGTMTLTKLDLTNKRISGTFSFTGIAVPNTNASGIRSVTGGSFTDVPLQ